MLIRSSTKNGYQVLKVIEGYDGAFNLEEIQALLKEYLECGDKKIALSFSSESPLDSKPIRILVACNQMVRAHGGTLGVICPDEHITSVLQITGLVDEVRIFSSEEDVGR